MSKPKTTKTLGPLHFEDLEPHRFESLVRNLLYDFRDWQIIEPTGQSGNDDGFDIRAWEKIGEITNEDETAENKESEKGTHPMDGHLWMIQCKREKELGPSRIEKILITVDKKTPPYGYILVAPVNFSKKSYDGFRKKLREKGVLEFYLWGKLELEDMLYLPKNDRILFTFFGISLTTQRRSKGFEIKFLLNNKNKLFRILNGQQNNDLRESVLVRDFNDDKYPYKGEYRDFEKRPRWKEYIAYMYHPLGLWVHINERYAFINPDKKEFAFIEDVDLLNRESDIRLQRNTEENKKREYAEDFWAHLPLRNRVMLKKEGIIFYEDMLVIDEKGDTLYQFPHIYVDYKKYNSPFRGYRYLLGNGNDTEAYIDAGEEKYKQVNILSKKFAKPRFGKIYKEKFVEWDEETIRLFKNQYPYIGRIYDTEGKYSYLEIRDVIAVKKPVKDYEGDTKDKYYLEITYKYTISVSQFLKENGESFKESIERQVGRQINKSEKMTVLEVRDVNDWKLGKN